MKVRTYHGGEQASKGTYWNVATWEFSQSPGQGSTLPGARDQRYLRIPVPLVLLLGPLIGLGYVIFLPLVGIVGLLVYAARQLARQAQRPVQTAAQVVVPSWVPGVSYLVRGHKDKAQRNREVPRPVVKAADRLMEKTERELAERRRKGEK